jgi:type VI secretion system ImpB/VipA family protein
MRVVVLSAVAAQDTFSTGAAPPMEPFRIDRLTFDSVMVALGPSLSIRVPDPFDTNAEPLTLELCWRELKGLRPDALCASVPALRALAEARRVVQRSAEGRIGGESAQAELSRILPRSEWATRLAEGLAPRAVPAAASRRAASENPPPRSASPSAIDALLERVQVEPGEAGATAESGLSRIVAAVARGNRTAPRAGTVVEVALDRVDRAFARLLGDILRHPEVRRLERAWRGLRLLVERSETPLGVEVDVVATPRHCVTEALRALSEPEGRHASRAPVDLLVVDHEIGPDDARELHAWAELAEKMLAPLVVNGSPSLLGAARIAELPKRLAEDEDPRPPDLRWVAAQEASRWVAVAMNGPIARASYTASSSRLRDVPFAEDPREQRNQVFAGPALAVAALCTQSFARTGWASAIIGPREGLLGDLPVWEAAESFGSSFAIPLEALVSEDAVRLAARAGIALLGCATNHDGAVLARAPVLHRVESDGAPRSTTTLGDQLFVGRVGHAVQQMASALPASVDPSVGAEVARNALEELFPNSPPAGPEIDARIRPDGVLEVCVRPRRFAGTSLEEITLTARLEG